jgi:hypothetical protein
MPWTEFAAGGYRSRSIPDNRSRGGKVRRLYFLPALLLPYAKHSSPERQIWESQAGTFCLYSEKDPDGKPIQLSNH